MLNFNFEKNVIFPTYVWDIFIEGIDNQSIKNYCLNVRENKEGVQISNRGGWHSKELIYPLPKSLDTLFSNIVDFCSDVCSPQIGILNLKVANFWININSKYDYNISHDHQKSILSGVFYVDVPNENMGDIYFHRDDNAEFFITSRIEKNPNSFNENTISIRPKTNQLLLFPSWIKHSVGRNESNSERISIAFNLVQETYAKSK